MNAHLITFCLTLGLIIVSPSSHAQEPPQMPPVGTDLNIPPSPPDASIPGMPGSASPEMPVGVSQQNPDYAAEAEIRNETERREESSQRNAVLGGEGGSSKPSSKFKKLKIAKMEKGPAISPDAWKKGKWYHGKHDGTFAWWWIIDTTYFRYDKAAYPFPDHDKRQVFIPNAGSTSLSSVAPGQR